MGRIRTIKPEFHAHEELSALPPETHLLAAALLNYADDEGYFNANPVLLKAGTTPLRNDGTTIEEQISQLEKVGYIEVRRSGIKAFGRVLNFTEHQKVSHPTASKIRDKFDECGNASGEPTETLRRDSGNTPENFASGSALKGKERNREQGVERNGSASAPRGESRSKFVFPEWIDREAWDAWEGMRVRMRKPLSDHARTLAVGELDKLRAAGNNPSAVLNQSTLRGWTGLFPVNDRDTRQAPPPPKTKYVANPEAMDAR